MLCHSDVLYTFCFFVEERKNQDAESQFEGLQYELVTISNNLLYFVIKPRSHVQKSLQT